MRFFGISIFLLALAVSINSCKKNEIDLAELSTNPFDQDYNGAPFFTFVQDNTTEEVNSNGMLVRYLNVEVAVHRELLANNPPFSVQIRSESGFSYVVTSNDIIDDRITIRNAGVLPGDVRCWELQIGNGGIFAAGNQVCGTAD